MEGLLDFLNYYLNDEIVMRRVLVALSATAIFILGLGLSFLILNATSPVRRRLGLADDTESGVISKNRLAVTVTTALGPVASYVLPQKEEERTKITKQLFRAGFRSPQALQVFYAVKSFAIVALPLFVLLTFRFVPALENKSAFNLAAIAAAIGMFTPNLVLSRLVDRRAKAIRNAFPDALDLLVVCVESGLGLAAAIQRVADELDVSHPELAFEMSTVNAEIRAGVPRENALRNLAERTGLQDIRGLVGLLVQTMKFGTSISDALRVYSEEFRDKRMQRAEEQAAKMGTKLIFPLVFCMFPVFFIVAIGPAVLRIIEWMTSR
jgi:tight adherence protein C